MTYALVAGTLFHVPEQKTSKAGKPYITATLKVKDGDSSQFWRVTAFSEAVSAELMRLSEGDAVSAQGILKVETYQKNDETKISLSIIADHILALRQPPREKAAGEQRQAVRYPTPAAQGKPSRGPGSPDFHRTDAPPRAKTHGCNSGYPSGSRFARSYRFRLGSPLWREPKCQKNCRKPLMEPSAGLSRCFSWAPCLRAGQLGIMMNSPQGCLVLC